MLNKARHFYRFSTVFPDRAMGWCLTMLPGNLAFAIKNIKRELSEISGTKKLENRMVTISTYSLFEFMISMRISDKQKLPGDVSFLSPEMDCETRLRRLRSKEVDIDIGTGLQQDRSIVQVSLFKCKLNILMRRDNKKSQ